MDYLKAFVIGGALCVIAQILIDKTKLTPGGILVGYVTCGVLLGAFGIYKPFAEFAKSGATVPLTGFGYLIADGTRKAIEENGLIGALTGPLTSSAGGITAALLAGLLTSIIFKPKKQK